MKQFDNSSIRRQDRTLDAETAFDILRKSEFGVLSMIHNSDNGPSAYGIPLNFVWDNDNYIYFHCAPVGEKLTNIDTNPNVSFCVVGNTNVIAHKFTTAYQSVVVKGSICRNLHADERMKALELILDKYAPNDKVIGMKYAEKSFHRTEILRLSISHISAKSKVIAP